MRKGVCLQPFYGAGGHPGRCEPSAAVLAIVVECVWRVVHYRAALRGKDPSNRTSTDPLLETCAFSAAGANQSA